MPPRSGRSGRSWRDTVAGAADVVLTGVVALLAALPVVTAGAALAAASFAMHTWVRDGSWPQPGQLWSVYRRNLLPGLAATGCLLAFAGLVAANITVLRAGRAPGGTVAVAATLVLAVAAAGLAPLVLVEVGRRGGGDWRGALRWAVRTGWARPWLVAGLAGVVGCAALLAAFIPPLVLLVPGPALYATHAVATRLA